MKIFKFLKSLIPEPGMNQNVIYLYYQCHKCKHVFSLILRKSYDIQTLYDEESEATFLYQKELRDSKCFNDIKLRVYFDKNYKVLSQEIKGGQFISEEEYLSLKSK
ncbi:MAG: hypothetical protein KAX49_13640 [Halanaerobiales bacterium]|nr:hypothetical protein [Halanaerobiales bacterium]